MHIIQFKCSNNKIESSSVRMDPEFVPKLTSHMLKNSKTNQIHQSLHSNQNRMVLNHMLNTMTPMQFIDCCHSTISTRSSLFAKSDKKDQDLQKLRSELDLISQINYELCADGDEGVDKLSKFNNNCSNRSAVYPLSLSWKDVRYISDNYKHLIVRCYLPSVPNAEGDIYSDCRKHEYQISFENSILQDAGNDTTSSNMVECVIIIRGIIYQCVLQCNSLPAIQLENELSAVAGNLLMNAEVRLSSDAENVKLEAETSGRYYQNTKQFGTHRQDVCGVLGSPHSGAEKRRKLNRSNAFCSVADAPPLTFHSLRDLHTCMVEVLSRYTDYYNTMREFEENTIILEPELSITDTSAKTSANGLEFQSFELSHRNGRYSNPWRKVKLVALELDTNPKLVPQQLNVGVGVDIGFTVNAKYPRQLPHDMRFYGSSSAVEKYKQIWSEYFNNHIKRVEAGVATSRESLKAHLEKIFGVTFPRASAVQPDIVSPEHEITCGICYSHTLQSPNDSNIGLVPTEMCVNKKCNTQYHKPCLVNWLSSLPTSRRSFGMVFGQCIFCQESINVRTVGM